MGFFDKLRSKLSKENPPDFSSFDEDSFDDPFKNDQTGVDSTMQNSSADNLLGNQAQQKTGPIIRTEPSSIKMPGYSNTNPAPEENSNFNHELFRQPNYQQENYSSQENNSGIVYQEISHRQADLILEKLDTVKAELDAIKQRMKHIEMLVDTRDRLNTQKRYL